MNLKCKLGIHVWNGCMCSACGLKRDTNHAWKGCKCEICGHIRNEAHQWEGCKCQVCGQARDEGHKWVLCQCELCGKRHPVHHTWENGACIRCGLKFDEPCEKGDTPLHNAAWVGTMEEVTRLVEMGASLTALDGNGCTPLACAMQVKDAGKARYLVAQGANPAACMKGGKSVLHQLWLNRGAASIEAARLGLQLVSSVDLADETGMTPLADAAMMRHPLLCCVLLSNGADWKYKNKNGQNVRDVATTLANHMISYLKEDGQGSDLGAGFSLETIALLTYWNPSWNYRSNQFDTYECSKCGVKHSQIDISLQPGQAMANSPNAKDSYRAALEVAGADFWTCPGCQAHNTFPPELGR